MTEPIQKHPSSGLGNSWAPDLQEQLSICLFNPTMSLLFVHSGQQRLLSIQATMEI